MAELIMLRLEGILQAWGEDAKWDTRTSAAMPTKSGIVGLIACAMGLSRADSDIRELSDSITVGVRADRSGDMFTDFHTVQGMPDIYNAEGKKRAGNTIVSNRQYLQDASFLVALETNETWRKKIVSAFENPVWSVYLGRKSCVPSLPVFEGVCSDYNDIVEALHNYPAAKNPDANRSYEVETPMENCGTFSRPDAVVGKRTFNKRIVWRGVIREDSNVSDKS